MDYNPIQPRTSTIDNCLITRILIMDGSPQNDNDLRFLTELVHLPPNLVQLYYEHSKKIINKMIELNLDNQTTWSKFYDEYVKYIIKLIQDKDFNLVVNEIQKMFFELEQTYGVD